MHFVPLVKVYADGHCAFNDNANLDTGACWDVSGTGSFMIVK